MQGLHFELEVQDKGEWSDRDSNSQNLKGVLEALEAAAK